MLAAPLAIACVLCCVAIVNKGDKNLVAGRTEFNVKSEMLSLDFSVEFNSSYICRCCLVKLKKRRTLISTLREVNDSLRQAYTSNATRKPCSQDLPASKRLAVQDAGLPYRPVAFHRIAPITSSTPVKDRELQVLMTVPTVSPIRAPIIAHACDTSGEQQLEKKTTV